MVSASDVDGLMRWENKQNQLNHLSETKWTVHYKTNAWEWLIFVAVFQWINERHIQREFVSSTLKGKFSLIFYAFKKWIFKTRKMFLKSLRSKHVGSNEPKILNHLPFISWSFFTGLNLFFRVGWRRQTTKNYDRSATYGFKEMTRRKF